MPSLELENEPVADRAYVTQECLVVGLADGRSLSVPLTWYPRLANATTVELQNVKILGGGYAIEWPDLDEHIGVESLIAGHRSGESAESLQRWLDARKSP
jgi:hypothetical protein